MASNNKAPYYPKKKELLPLIALKTLTHRRQIIESLEQFDAIIVGSGAGGGMSAKVLADACFPEFIDFIAKDIPSHELPIKDGIMRLESRCNNTFNLPFSKLTNAQLKSILDWIAYHDGHSLACDEEWLAKCVISPRKKLSRSGMIRAIC